MDRISLYVLDPPGVVPAHTLGMTIEVVMGSRVCQLEFPPVEGQEGCDGQWTQNG